MATTVTNNTVTNSAACSSGSKASRYKLYLQLTENSYDINTNKSNVSYKGWIQGTTTVTTFYGYPMTGTIKNGNTTLASGSATATRSKPVSSANKYTLASGSSDFTHNSDGSLTITLTFTYSSNSPHASAGSVSTTLTLTKIPRASTIVAIDCDIESATSITINKSDNSFTTTLSYSFAGSTNTPLTGTIVTKTADKTYGWTVPSSFYAKIPDNKSGVCTLTATTYSGNTSLGTTTTTFKVTASEDRCGPTGSISVVDGNETTSALTGNTSTIVNGKSTANCTITRAARNSASVSSVTINGTSIGTSATTYSIPNATTDTYTLVVTDSRGYSSTFVTTKTFVNYIPLTCNVTFKRNTATDGKVKLNYTGNYFNGSFGSSSNTLSVKYRYKETSSSTWSNWVTITPTVRGNTYSQELLLSETFPYNKEYDFQIQVTDKLTTITPSGNVKKGIPVYWWNQNSFNVEVDAYIKGSAIPTLDLIYPIGSIYMSINNTNPGTLFGGTWEQIQDRFLLSAGSTYIAGSTGGSATVTLSINEIPSHSHSGTTAGAGEHSHLLGGNTSSVASGSSYARPRGYSSGVRQTTYDTNVAGNHTHTFSTNSVGGNQSHNNMPPYLAVYVWKRTA